MIRVYLFDKWIEDSHYHEELDTYVRIVLNAQKQWGKRVKLNEDATDHFQIWLEFDNEEEAALFKLTYT